MKKKPLRKNTLDVEILAKAEKILNRTLAYQAAIAVHELKDALGLDVEELRLVVAPVSTEALGVYRVICTIANVQTPDPVLLDFVVEPEKAIAPKAKKEARAQPETKTASKGGSRKAN